MSKDKTPLISCIMPTKNRRAFVPQALHYFLTQDYPNKELIIIDDGEDTVSDLIPVDRRIHYIQVSADLTTGMKRNIACSVAHGDILCQQDDDDYYGPLRLSDQVLPILDGDADVTGLVMDAVLHLPEWTCWRCSEELHREIFPAGVHTGTLMFRRALWDAPTTFPNKGVGEDAGFLRGLLHMGARLVPVTLPGQFVYVRQSDHNVWPLPPHQHPHMHEWKVESPEETTLPADALIFYLWRHHAIREGRLRKRLLEEGL